jgi:hypothetical protein
MRSSTAYLLIVTARIDVEVEEEWNRWYDDVHLPAALACPGVMSGTRHVSEGDASAIDHDERSTDAARVYTTVYEIEGPQTLKTPEFQAMRGWYQFSGRIDARTQVVRRL